VVAPVSVFVAAPVSGSVVASAPAVFSVPAPASLVAPAPAVAHVSVSDPLLVVAPESLVPHIVPFVSASSVVPVRLAAPAPLAAPVVAGSLVLLCGWKEDYWEVILSKNDQQIVEENYWVYSSLVGEHVPAAKV